MTKKTTFSLTQIKDCCSKKGVKSTCCKNTQIKLEKIKDNYTPSDISKTPKPESSLFVLAFVNSFLFTSTQNDNRDLFLTYHAPPGKSVSRTILYRAILI